MKVKCDDIWIEIIQTNNLNDEEVSSYAEMKVKEIAANFWGVNNTKIRRTSYGKPYFEYQNEMKFSISHTYGMVALAFCKGYEIGIDIEKVHPVSEQIINRFFSKEEKEEVYLFGNTAYIKTEIWTRKEAYAKCVGSGLCAEVLYWNSTREQNYFIKTLCLDDYIITVCRVLKRVVKE